MGVVPSVMLYLGFKTYTWRSNLLISGRAMREIYSKQRETLLIRRFHPSIRQAILDQW